MQSDSLWIDLHPLLRDEELLLLRRLDVAGLSHGFIARIFDQNGSMSTTRSLTIGRFPIAEIDRAHARLSTIGSHPLLAGEHGGAVHAHPARAADHHPAALPERERPVDLVLDDVEHVEQARPLGRLDLVVPQRRARP